MTLLSLEDRSEILRYLSYRGSELTEGIEKRINDCIKAANEAALIKSTYRRFKIEEKEEGIALMGTGVMLLGNSLKKHLNGAEEAVLFCITLGASFDTEIEKMMVSDPASGVILNSAGITLIEKAADDLQKEIDETLPGGFHTGVRFSPGYGDLPLEFQRELFRVLDCPRTVGVTLGDQLLMMPTKSVTAIIGAKEKQP